MKMKSAVILQSDPRQTGAAPLPGCRQEVRGHAAIRFERRDGETRLAHLAHQAPLRVLFPRPAEGDVAQAALVNISGALIAGDQLDIDLSVGQNAAAVCVAGAAEKICRSGAGETSLIRVNLTAERNAWAEWLPQESIFFNGARLRRAMALRLEAGARILAGEFLVLGRAASGESVTDGYLRDAFEVRQNGRLIWADALRLDGGFSDAAAAKPCLHGARALATLVHAGEGAAAALDMARRLQQDAGEGVFASASAVNGVLVMRWLSPEPWMLRERLGKFWAAFRHQAAGLPQSLPRIWHV